MNIKYAKLECHRKVKLILEAGNILVEVFLERAQMSVAINISNEPFMNPVDAVFIFLML